MFSVRVRYGHSTIHRKSGGKIDLTINQPLKECVRYSALVLKRGCHPPKQGIPAGDFKPDVDKLGTNEFAHNFRQFLKLVTARSSPRTSRK